MSTTKARAVGFTLVELLIVLAVVAILAAITFTVFARARERGNSAVCQSNLKQIALGIQQYVQDHTGQYPPAMEWYRSIEPYIKNAQVFSCPTQAPNVLYRTPMNYGYNHLRLNKSASQQLQLHGRHETSLPNAALIWVNLDEDLGGSFRTAPGTCGNLLGGRTLHSGGGNYSFADGHVKWLTPEQIAEIECSLGTPNVFAP